MTFKEAYDLVNDKKQCIKVYTISGQGEDFIIHQTLICAAKMEPHKDEIREEMGLQCDVTDIVLLDGKNNEIVRGLENETHWLNIYLSMNDAIKTLKHKDWEDYDNMDICTSIPDIYDMPDHDEDEQEWLDWYDDEMSRIIDDLNDLNDAIEKVLSEIDKKYQTNFAPTGAQRLY